MAGRILGQLILTSIERIQLLSCIDLIIISGMLIKINYNLYEKLVIIQEERITFICNDTVLIVNLLKIMDGVEKLHERRFRYI